MSHDIVRISTLARRVAREHNRCLAPGEFSRPHAILVFDAEGRLRETAAQDSFAFGPEALVYRSRPEAVSAREVQAWLDAR